MFSKIKVATLIISSNTYPAKEMSDTKKIYANSKSSIYCIAKAKDQLNGNNLI